MRRVIMIVVLLLATSAAKAQATEPPLTPVQHELYMAVARMCANEAFNSYGDCALIWQTVRGRGATDAERLAWLRDYSNCVLVPDVSPARLRVGNCRWTRNLQDNDQQPEGWPNNPRWRWEGVNQRQWARVRATVRAFILGARPRGGWPCPIAPTGWAGRRTDEQHIANMGPNSVPLGCTDPMDRRRRTLNEGFRNMTPEQRAAFEARFPPAPAQPTPAPEAPPQVAVAVIEPEYVDINEGRDVDVD